MDRYETTVGLYGSFEVYVYFPFVARSHFTSADSSLHTPYSRLGDLDIS